MTDKNKVLYREFLDHLKEFSSIRHELHQIPELKFEEFKTTQLLQGLMKKFGYEVKTGFAITGFTAVLDSGKPGKVAAIRTEIDCNAMHEVNNLPYKSTHPGRMHACGHDGHMATILMIAKVLANHKDDFRGKIKFLFQPAEELGGGAKVMIDDGVMDDPKVDVAFAYHNMPTKKGIIAAKSGPVMAGVDDVHIILKGKGGHGALPEFSHNPIVSGLSVLNEISLLKMQKGPLDPYLLNICSFHSGTEFNVIPDEAELKFTLRFFTSEKRNEIIEDVKRILENVSKQHKIEYELKTGTSGYPATINHEAEVNLVLETAADIVEPDMIEVLEKPVMGSEDFSYFLEKVPGCMFFVGNGEENVNHNSSYKFDDAIIPKAAYILAKSAMNWLNQN